MRLSLALTTTALATVLTTTAATLPADAGPPAAGKPGHGHGRGKGHGPRGHGTRHEAVRFATFNASLNRNAEGDLVRDLSTGGNAQARNVAEIIQRTDPDVLLVNEFE